MCRAACRHRCANVAHPQTPQDIRNHQGSTVGVSIVPQASRVIPHGVQMITGKYVCRLSDDTSADQPGTRVSPARGSVYAAQLHEEGDPPMPTTDPTTRWPNYRETDFVIENYVFASRESLPELRLHYRTMGVARRDAAGGIVNGGRLLEGKN